AARCQVAAISARSVEAWQACVHPEVQAAFGIEMTRASARAGVWDDLARKTAPLATLTTADFTLAPLPAATSRLGDQRASYRLPDDSDSLDVVRKDGRWYVVDSGI
nr:hypothetical protein [Myxococcota bacterium]